MTTFNSLMTAVLMNTATKITTALGVGFVSYKGLGALQYKFIDLIQDKLNGLPADALNLLMLGGLGDYLNWTMSGVTFALSIKSTTFLTTKLRTM